MYAYLLGQLKLGKITAEYVQARCPRFITQEEVDTIIATPLN